MESTKSKSQKLVDFLNNKFPSSTKTFSLGPSCHVFIDLFWLLLSVHAENKYEHSNCLYGQ